MIRQPKKITFNLISVLTPMLLSIIGKAETVGVFYDPSIAQIEFAAGDVKTALEAKKFTVEIKPLEALTTDYAQKKVVISTAQHAPTRALLKAQGGTLASGLGEQAFSLNTTVAPATSYWVFGGDANGAMYGGLQIAENISFEGFSKTYNSSEAPAVIRRGIKLNLALDQMSGTYGKTNATAKIKGLPHIWDTTFWHEWFDFMARNRYNVLSIWNNHPFPSFVKVPGYEECAIQDVTGIEKNSTYKKTMSIEQKIVFWKDIMAYARSRGFEFYVFNWNLWLENAAGKYGIDDHDQKKVTHPTNIDYMRKSMTAMWETYPDLSGFGITQGENMSDNEENNALFLAKTYGQGTLDYAKKNPDRKIKLIHRWHLADFSDIKNNFGELMAMPNITLDMSFKYSLAHMYSIRVPMRMDTQKDINPLVAAGLKSFLTVRNDDFYFHNWGDPDFCRAYVNGMISRGEEGEGNPGSWFAGFYMGQDSYSPTRTFFSKNSVTQGMLDVERQWYMHALWGRLSYNPNTSDETFKNIMAQKYPDLAPSALFTSWQNASKSFPLLGELICGTLGRDNQWWPEACQAFKVDETVDSNETVFVSIADFAAAKTMGGSSLASIDDTARNKLGKKRSAFDVADEMEGAAQKSLEFAMTIQSEPNTHQAVMADNLKALSYLSLYYADKIRGAIYSKQDGKKSEAKAAMGKAYGFWIKYSSLMDKNFEGITLARSAELPNWKHHDALVLKEYTDLGGEGIPK